MGYDFPSIEQRWQQRWRDERKPAADKSAAGEKMYLLAMFPYPSGDGLHVGHSLVYTAADVLARYWRSQGRQLLFPMGWDAFGLPAENTAIRKGVHPRELTEANIATFRHQIERLGLSFDWSRELNTSDPSYYKWTQWLFLQLFKKGLAYQKEAKVNWCESCQTVLANEQVIGGNCERCGHPVIQRSMKQWFFKITAYVEQLLAAEKELDWPPSILAAQRNWVGRSTGAILHFALDGQADRVVDVFTTRPDTLFGATYLVLAPEHPLLSAVELPPSQRAEVMAYIKTATHKTDLERSHLQTEKSGVFSGLYGRHPLTKERLPIYVADFILPDYGTGSVMAVPAHDERDFAFAKAHALPIIPVIEGFSSEQAYLGDGRLINSAQFDGQLASAAAQDIVAAAGGEPQTTYRLRDWLVSRQRYWGAPIPIIYCDDCGVVPVPERELPVLLPEDVDFKPHGHSPLADSPTFLSANCPKCGKDGRRETDTMDTFVCSSWYYLRFVNPDLADQPFNLAELTDWLPVDLYIGGAEHAVLHLLYARFINRVLFEEKLVPSAEPFSTLRSVGLVLGPDHQKMSKSRGNVINPDQLVKQHGADALRLHELFLGPFSDEKPWSDIAIKGVERFLNNFWRLIINEGGSAPYDPLHGTIKKVAEDTEALRFNTAIAALMTFVNARRGQNLAKNDRLILLQLLYPYAPHISSELYERLTGKDIATAKFPKYDPKTVVKDEVEVVVQVNGRRRASFVAATGTTAEELKKISLEQKNVAKHLAGQKISKTIVVPDRLVNIVLSS